MNKIEKAEKKLEKMKQELKKWQQIERETFKQNIKAEKQIERLEEEIEEFIEIEITWYKERPYELLPIKVLNLPKDIEKRLKKKRTIIFDNVEDEFEIKTIEDILISSKEELLAAGFNIEEINIIRAALKKHNAYMDGDEDAPEDYDDLNPIDWKD